MWQAQSLGMSSDSLADLGRSLGRVSEEIIRLVDTSKRRNAGSPADKEADVKPVRGEWSVHPGRDLVATVLMQCWSCADHLRVTAYVLAERRGVASLYTQTRAAVDVGSMACYPTNGSISAQRPPVAEGHVPDLVQR
jgi:hypothetical protein